ncbi:MAG: UDP-N-acetylglucosamine 1-carboxyvinyltransferase [Clostridia bacterium]|nr:UDP-N-acetylglucosamine 1-carboxyvinyltransferase [Clostridia bacterium]
MEKLRIRGGRPLNGTIPVSGMKNSALPILFACALNDETCVLQNVPAVRDVATSIEILRHMGVSVTYRTPTTLEVNGAGFRPLTSPDELVENIRASSYLMGVELARCGRTDIAIPGGCKFGSRPLDYHTKAFEIMGAEMERRTRMTGEAPEGLHDGKIMLDTPSVGATINIMLAASRIPGGITTINNAAREPHIVDLALFLNACGVTVKGAGTSEIKVYGAEKLHGCTHKIIPDMIEAGTYMVAVAACGGRVTLTNAVSKHLEAVTSKLTEMGVRVEESEDGNSITVVSDGAASLKSVQIKTDYYPGFPTDMHPQFAALLCASEGISTVTENIWARRFAYLKELAKTGVAFSHSELGSTATFFGGQKLLGAEMDATDLRGGAAMVIAALMGEGESTITSPEYIDRGYDDLIGKLSRVGADIARVEVFKPCTQQTAAILS